ncbi:hypothetical protein [Mucilaginibacter pedocola]|uniref:Uncharacterized protein n=1 Tax=Mucilaginibacter pedocola TaxID=1792845 RepID=A0A1S9PMK5_9SPHI|nr:hypothetical protein [Mucilaginibacter pedocola]OOQ62192.1 hypothetical protein BC343_03875 [Mucilaginibacter pedocola]
MRPSLLNIGVSSIGLGVVIPEFSKSESWDTYICDFDKKDSETSTRYNRSLKNKKYFFTRDTKGSTETICEITDFYYLENKQDFQAKFLTTPDLLVCLDFESNDFERYITIVEETLLWRKKNNKLTVVLSTRDFRHFLGAKYVDSIEVLCDKLRVPYLKSVFDVFTYKTRMVNDELTAVVENISGRWHICKSDFNIYPVDFFTLIENILNTKLIDQIKFDKMKLSKFLNELVIEVLGFFCEYNGDVFLNEYLSKHEGKKIFRRIVSAVIAIYKIRDNDIFAEFKTLENRLSSNYIDCIKVTPWLIDKKPNLKNQERLKEDLKHKELKQIDFREIEILIIFFKRIGLLPPL